MATEHEPQRIARFTPLAEVLARIDELVRPVAPHDVDLAAAAGRVSAADLRVRPHPGAIIAIRDGWAVSSESTADASGYAPSPLSATRIDTGEPLPAGCDAVAPIDAVVERNGRREVVAPIAAGEGVLPVGADTDWRNPLTTPGKLLRPLDIAVLSALGIKRATICEPRICVARARLGADSILDSVCDFIAAGVTAAGGEATIAPDAAALVDSKADAVIVIGGTGSGRNDDSVHALARAGRVEFHGVALMPGETAAFGMAGTTPVLLVPGRLDAALAVWLTLGRHLLTRLTGSTAEPAATRAVLARKIASPLGFTEIVPVRCSEGKAEPIASGYWPLSTIAQSDAWLMVPPDSEGYPAGAEVMLRPWL
jgi:molybdopterin biosynthesis enzyme